MLKTGITTNINGTSYVEENGGEAVSIASMSASIDENGKISESTNIFNENEYEKHKNMVQEDINEFHKLVYNTSEKKLLFIE